MMSGLTDALHATLTLSYQLHGLLCFLRAGMLWGESVRRESQHVTFGMFSCGVFSCGVFMLWGE